MEYLLYFNTSKNFLPLNNSLSLGSHCTLCFFIMDSEKETSLLQDLVEIKFKPFEISTKDFQKFDNNSLVLTLFCSKELLNLHKKLLELASKYSKISSKYFGENYHPHITLSKTSTNFEKNNNLLNQKIKVNNFILAKKIKGKWEIIQIINSKN